MRPRRKTVLVLMPLALWLAAVAPASAARGDLESVLEAVKGSVVPVHMLLRPIERPPGGEGQRVEEVFCGVIVGDALVVVSADAFPDPGLDPRTTLEPVAFAVLAGGERRHELEVAGLNRELNLAYLRFTGPLPDTYRPVKFGGASEPRLGEEIYLIGLLPKRYDYAPTFWPARISARITSPRPMYAVSAFVQDLSIGGLAVDARGRALGIVAEDILPSGQATDGEPSNPLTLFGSLSQGPRVGYPMVFPFEVLSADLESPPPVVREPRKAWFGITMQPLNRELGDYWDIDNPGGIIISSVLDGSPAQGAGLHPRDILLRLGETPVTAREFPDLALFRRMVERLPIGEEVPLLVWRDGQRVTLQMQPGVAPRTGFLARQYEDEDFGLTVRELTVDQLQARNLPTGTEGVWIADLENAGWAQLGGLSIGDIILRVNDSHITDPESLAATLDALRPGRPREVYFFVQRNVETRFVTVRPDW